MMIMVLLIKFVNMLSFQMKRNTDILLKNVKTMVLKNLKDPKALIEFSSNIPDVVKNIEEYNPCIKRKILIVFDDMTADMLSN